MSALTVKLLTLFLVSMVPVVELRGAIPMGVVMEVPFWQTYLVCVAGNILPVPFLVLFARRILFWLAGNPQFGHFFQRIIDTGNRKADTLGKYEFWSLFVFVAIPLPGTGAWTGSLIATLLQMPLRKAFASIAMGVATSGIIMWVASSGVLGWLGLS